MLLRVTLVNDVGWALKYQKLAPRFIGAYQILKIVREMAYTYALP